MKKKLCLFAVLLLGCLQLTNAQERMVSNNTTSILNLTEEALNTEDLPSDQIVYYIDQLPGDTTLCVTNNQQVVVYAQNECDDFMWRLDGVSSWDNPLTINPQVHRFYIEYISFCNESGGEFSHQFHVEYKANTVPNSFTEYVWAPEGEPFNLQAVGEDSLTTYYGYDIHWQNGPSSNDYSPAEPGDYIATISHPCGTATRVKKCRWIPQIKSAAFNPSSENGLAVNVTWEPNEHIVPYLGTVNLVRDGIVIGPINYANDTLFVDNVPLEAQRVYQLEIIDQSGSVCPDLSEPKPTFFVMHVLGVDGVYSTWQPLVGYGVIQNYWVGEYIPSKAKDGDGEIIYLDVLPPTATGVLCPYDMFGEGAYALIAAVIEGEEKVQKIVPSNRTRTTTDGIDEKANVFNVYPNPARDGTFTISSPVGGEFEIVDCIGRVVASGFLPENTIKTINIPNRGTYVLRIGDKSTKIVVD